MTSGATTAPSAWIRRRMRLSVAIYAVLTLGVLVTAIIVGLTGH